MIQLNKTPPKSFNSVVGIPSPRFRFHSQFKVLLSPAKILLTFDDKYLA